MDLQEALFTAQSERASGRAAALRRADAALGTLRQYLRLAFRWQWLTPTQYEHVSRMTSEIGRLVGGWIKQTDT